ncbi:uncharacterized protein LOC121418798 [Lytechinus variegatus]|uniref:uncharacterized protein LOC121418798 n=1 Tax=Lytechinus variegatus TaxID=7654 RepID=UPI001BB1E2C4|nr:uncharacterized protein LOC121418798 [Lytechinus variegatus]
MPAKPSPEDTKLLFDVAKKIEATNDGLSDFRNVCRDQKHIRAFDYQKKRAFDIIQELKRKMIVQPGKFEKFVEILEIIGRADVIKMLPGYEDYESMKGVNNNQDNKDTMMSTPQRNETSLDGSSPSSDSSSGTGRVTDIELSNLSDNISPDRVLRLGIFLGIRFPKIETIMKQGGTLDLLINWRKNVPERDQRQELHQALKEASLGHLVTACVHGLGDGNNSSPEDEGPLSRSSIISEKMLSGLAGRMGEGWSHFGIQHLGMSKIDIDHFKSKGSCMEDEIFFMLYEWRQRNGKDATIGKLLDLIESSPYFSPDTSDFILKQLSIDVPEDLPQ